MRIFIFALFLASCYASPPLGKGSSLPPAIVTKRVVLPQKTVTVQRDIPVRALPRLLTISSPVPSVPNIVTIDKRVSVPSTPRIVTIHKQVPVRTKVVVPRPIPSPPRIITIERPVPVPQTVIVDKPYLVPTPVIIPRPVPVWVNKKSAIAKRGPINLQPIIASGPLSRPLPTPLAHPQSLITGRTSSGAITIGNLGGPILVGDRVLEAPLLAPGQHRGRDLAQLRGRAPSRQEGRASAQLGGRAPARLGGLAPSRSSSRVPLSLERNVRLNSNVALNENNRQRLDSQRLNRPNLDSQRLNRPNLDSQRLNRSNLNRPLLQQGQIRAPLLVEGDLGILGAPLVRNQQWILESSRRP